MAFRLRIARGDRSKYTPMSGSEHGGANQHAELDALIRRHLPDVTASLFAQPVPSADGRVIEWYSSLSGQPVALTALPADEEASARAILADRLQAVRDLASRLPRTTETEVAQADALTQALSYPGDETVYVVGGQPVLTFWGHQPLEPLQSAPLPTESTRGPGGATAAAAMTEMASAPEATPTPPRRALPWWLWPLGLLALIALLAFLAYRFLDWGWRWPPWGPDYTHMLEMAQSDQDTLRQRLADLEETLRQRITECDTQRALDAALAETERLRTAAEGLKGQLAEQLGLCPLREQLEAAQREGQTLQGSLQTVEDKLAQAIKDCKIKEAEAKRKADQRRKQAEEQQRKEAEEAAKQAQKAPPAETPPQRKPGDLPPCPGERTPQEAPDVAIVLDASGSMAFPASASAAQIQKQLGSIGGLPGLLGSIILQQSAGPSRLDEAKKGVTNVARSLPNDVDIGMAVLQRCPRADNLGFYSGAERNKFYSRVRALRPQQGTPLAQGIEEAGRMVDGVNAPGVIVVISDGEDSCGGDPCAAARALKAQKPNIKINVVDILGNGAGKCVAKVTGGQVLTPEDGLAFENTIRKATQEAIKPAHCP